MVMSYLCRTPLLPTPHETKRMGSYLLFAVALYAGGMYVENIMGMCSWHIRSEDSSAPYLCRRWCAHSECGALPIFRRLPGDDT